MQQSVCTLTMAEGTAVRAPKLVICDRDRKWSADVRRRLRDAGIGVVLIPERAPNPGKRTVQEMQRTQNCADILVGAVPQGDMFVARYMRFSS